MSDVFKKDKKYYVVDYDELPFDPRDEYDHTFTFVTWLRNYSSPDGDSYDNPHEFLNTFDRENYEIINVHAYIHSAIHYYIKGTEPDDEWDSGFAGLMAAHKSDLEDMCENGETVHQCAMRLAKNELCEWEAYVNGFMLYVKVYDDLGNQIDSCGGYFDEDDILDDNGITHENFIGECDNGYDELLEMMGLSEFDIKIPHEYYWFTIKNRGTIEQHMKEYIKEIYDKSKEENKNGN